MDHLSDWHSFDPQDRSSYPKTNSAIQVKFAGGHIAEGDALGFLPNLKTLPKCPVVGWRYIKAYVSR
jgi:hypothetical protein